MRIYKNAWFAKFARKERIGDAALCDAVDRASRGLVDADMGNGLIKQRVAREGEGKSGGYRTLIFLKQAERAIFAFGFAKNDRENLNNRELSEFRRAASVWLGLSRAEFEQEIEAQALQEVGSDDQDL